jgi:hypothetical protein
VGCAGTRSITGLQLKTSATTLFRLRLTRADGGPIDIYDSSLRFETVTGLTSGQNGRPTIAAYIYDGLRESATTVVANITARDALNPGLGDMAYVLNDGTGSFALYVWDGNTWNLIGNEESAQSQARTYEVDYAVGGSTSIFLGNVSVDRKIESVSAEITVPFDDATANIQVGTLADTDLLFTGAYARPNVADTYMINPEYFVEDAGGQDIQYYVTVDPQAATVGNVTVKITYV